MIWRLLADLLVALHLAFIFFVLLGGLLVLRRPRLAWLHVPAVLWGAAIEFWGWICPLTPLEVRLRLLGGQAGYAEGFIARYLEPIVYPPGLTRGMQVALGAAVLLLNGTAYAILWRRRRGLRIHYLADRPAALPVLAEWHHREWARYNPGDTLEKRRERMREHLRRGGLPVTFVATKGGRPVGSAALVAKDMHGRDDLSPWLASVYVHPDHRRQGIAGRLVGRVVVEAARQGIERLYLFTPDQEALYARLGWRTIERTAYMGEPVVIMGIEPQRQPDATPARPGGAAPVSDSDG